MVDFEEISATGTENEIQEDNKWYGVPPKGEQPLPENRRYVLWILGVIVLEICIWGVYRYFTAPLFVRFGTLQFYIFHIIFAPTIHLIPILIFWRFVRKERGVPFVFTKKLLMSAVVVGFCAAIIWRLLGEFIYDALAGTAGGTVPGTFSLFNRMSSSTVLLFSIMTFVQFFVVGPVEELEFRSFAQDQASRVLPNWHALIFSSVLFGCSHIPIALFVYQFTPAEFVAALIGWISAGFVFGALYMWSRNIFACIIMHGMGNWQLSVFYFSSTELVGGMDSLTYMVVSIATSIIVDGIMILIFYLIHKYYWQPHRLGETALRGILSPFQKFVHDHDFYKMPIKTTAVYLVAFCVITCGIIMSATHAFGETDLSRLSYNPEETDGKDVGYLESLVESTDIDTDSGSLNEGDSDTITFTSEPEKYIRQVRVTVTWTDEDDIQYGPRTYQNQPDSFSVTINGPNATEEAGGENPYGSEGRIVVELSFTIEELSEIISTDGDDYEITIEITMVNAGDYEAPFGLMGFADDGNQYNYEIEIIWLVPE